VDHLKFIRAMSVRRLAALAFAVLTLAALGVLVGTVWLVKAGAFTAALWAAVPGVVVLIVIDALVWFQVDRLLCARAYNKGALPARPELYDFDRLNPPMHLEEMGGKRLKDLTFVVFDTETTGLKPSDGDLIIQIAGVKVRDNRQCGEAPFDRLVNPGRPIPKDSIRFHGITDDMVAGEPGIGDVLPAFKSFVGEAVLVAHNAAFDVRFLKLQEEATGVRFDNLVLDTLLLSVFLDAENRDHSLDAIARRLGIAIEGRHTALGDSIATARVFLRMLDMLEARGITTLRQAIDASVKMEHVRQVQKKLFT
tara:strand:- start:887 stop:1813 length:927 start_codon:yes stop_codon:yes gene_type:complete